jgi:dTDP-glucose 4,6-dehydratase
LDDRPLPLYEHTENRREWLHVLDHCRAIEAILLRGRIGATYNVGSGDERSIEQLADAILDALRKTRSLKQIVPERPGHDRRYLLDNRKITTELGWRPQIDFADGLASTIAWYAEHRPWWTKRKEDVRAELDEFAWRSAAPR